MTSSAAHFIFKDGALSWPETLELRKRVYPANQLESPIEWAQAERRLFLYSGEDIRAVAGLYQREILWDNQYIAIAGIGGVMTDPAYQRQGFGKQIIRHLVAMLKAQDDWAFVLLFCEDHNIPFYDSLGFDLFEGRLEVEQNGKTGPFAFRNVMVQALSKPAPAAGYIDLCGLPW
ncbi:MAG: GNAT family N-acetyltransferase [Parasphingorhabdus sp.]|uniref:GNAT family N-acetyltransferase n=1 Tax=Parasphingorhabdus sp. TaxID=2709688 RepID=UPI00329A343F